jgi:hypothetical protein
MREMRWSGLVLLLVSACGDDGGGSADAGIDAPSCAGAQGFDLTGRFGVQALLSVHVEGIVETDTVSELLLLLDTTQSQASVALTAQLCDILIPDIPIEGEMPVKFTPGPGLIASVAGVDGSGTLSQACFTSTPITMVIGARMDPPDQGDLPEAAVMGDMITIPHCTPEGASCTASTGAGCVCDQEQDGLPGATLLVENAPVITVDQAFVDLRTTFALAGLVMGSDAFQGTVTASLEQGIVGCHVGGSDPHDCNGSEVDIVQGLNPIVTQNADPSTFRAVGVDDTLTCAQLIAMKDTIFPR